MINYDKINELKNSGGHSKHGERILAQINFACNLNAAHDGRFDYYVQSAVDSLASDVEINGVITKKGAAECERLLLPLKEFAKEYTIYCVAHAHIDMNWMWGYQETVSVTVDTFRTILDLMNEYPTFTFAQSQASTYEIIEKYAPSMLDEIKQRIKEGRWEVSASTWVETDKNMPNGESLARHILYTKRYLSKLLDIDADSLRLDFEPDTFGHNANVPEICSAGGVKYYYHCRGSSHEKDAYVWQGENGSSLLVFRDPHWYSEEIHAGSFRQTPMICKRDGITSLLCVYGVGDHGGGPTRRDIERLLEMSQWPIMPKIKFSSYREFFGELEKIRDTLPVLTGERNFVFDGCYTSQAKIKMTNRISEDRMFESEGLASMSLMVGGENFASSFKRAYKNILFNHFHDILPGSGTVETREHALGTFQDSMAEITTNANLAMREIAKNIDTSLIDLEIDPSSVSEGGGTGFGVAHDLGYKLPSSERGMGKKRIFHLFNPTEYQYEGITYITVFDWNYNGARAVFTNDKGDEVESQLVEDGKHYWGHGYKKFALSVSIPPLGYSSYILDLKPAGGDGDPGLPYLRNDSYTGDDIILENDLIKAQFDHMTMELKSLTDKKSGKELISSPSCIFDLITENTIHGMTSWRVGDYMNLVNLNRGGNLKVYAVNTSGLCKHIKFSFNFGKRSDADVTVSLDKGDSMLKYSIKVNFHETGNSDEGIPQLAFEMPFGYGSEKCRFDIPFGTVDREVFDFDVPANSFAAPIPIDDSTGLMIVTDSKYGFRYTKNKLAVSLIRASFDPDPYPEYGVHYIRLAVGVCDITDDNRELYKNASKFIHPLPFCTANLSTRKGKLAMNKQFVYIEGNIKLSAIKPAEDSNGIVIRFYTPSKTTANYRISFADRVTSAYYTDINESDLKPAEITQNGISGKCNPSQIITALIKF